jgi:hypothetical protein
MRVFKRMHGSCNAVVTTAILSCIIVLKKLSIYHCVTVIMVRKITLDRVYTVNYVESNMLKAC